jgi:Tfp pilus assembly protein PilN
MVAQKRINLLPPEERRKASRERGLLYALLALVLVFAVLAILFVFENQRVSSRKTELSVIQSQIDDLNVQIARLKPYESLQSQRASMSDTAKQIYESRVVWSSIAEEISLLIPDTVRLTQLTGAVPAPMLAGSSLGGAAGAAGVGGADMQFQGTALSHKDVAEFMTRLGLMPQLYNIQLVSAAKSASTGSEGQTVAFQITASLRPFLVAPPAAVPVSGAAQ